VDKTHLDYVSRTRPLPHIASSVIMDIKLESVNVGREAEGHELDQRWDSVYGTPVVYRAGTVRLVMRDTAPAVSPCKDLRG
jgi:hypothetical protein